MSDKAALDFEPKCFCGGFVEKTGNERSTPAFIYIEYICEACGAIGEMREVKDYVDFSFPIGGAL